MSRAIAFTNTIASSKRLETHWDDIADQAFNLLPETEQSVALRCETRHVDGQHHALDRKARIEWLKGSAEGTCRILSNARCLSEGIDVPALDAVLFMNPRNSHVDIVQAVGRAMRKADGKDYGYIVLPIAVPADVDPAAILDDNERFAAVWSVLRALRSHDDRFDAEINKIDLNKTPTSRIIFSGYGSGDEDVEIGELPFSPLELPPGTFYARIVEKCGDRKYWEAWAKDVADIFVRLVEPQLEHYQIGTRKMRFADEAKTTLIVNDHVRLAGIPTEAHEYVVNGRTPLEWFIDRYRITQDKESGIVNDPNGWFDDPRDLVAAFRRIVHLSVETVRIINELPEPFQAESDESKG